MIDKNKVHAIIYSILGVLLLTVSITAIYQYNESKKLKLQVDNQYAKAFYEMTDYVGEIETGLRKGMLASSPAQLASISGDIYRLSTSAKSCLGELPITDVQLDNTSRFLSQVGDYTYVLAQNAINGTEISAEQYEDIEALTEYATTLTTSLNKIREGISNGDITFTSGGGINTVSAAGDILSDLENVEKSFQEYPSLIYDGPFSEHIENRESPMLADAQEVSLERAREIAAEFLEVDVSSLVFESDTQNSAIDAYNFYTDGDIRSAISISKKGGCVIYFLKTRNVERENLDFNAAIKCGTDFLNSKGYYALENNYYDKAYNIATVNYAFVQDGVTCYSDLIKVKIALDNGEILGMEANGYLMNHRKRDLPVPKASKESAVSRLSKHLELEYSEMALIPKDSLEEVLCYEFHGTFAGKNFIIYINADNLREEKILMLIESENGVLTV